VRITIVTPAPRGARTGNRITALRWAGQLRALGHGVRVAERWSGEDCDVLVALHATKSYASIARWRDRRPTAPLVVALGGTDLYQDLPASPEARHSLELATRIAVLQPLAIEALPVEVRGKARCIVQSARSPRRELGPRDALLSAPDVFRVCVVAHLRAVKDPFLAAEAARLLPARSRARVLHLGAALDAGLEARARHETAANPRYVWLGERRRGAARATVAGSALLVVTSRLEGGANVVSEAIAAGVPVLSTRIDGSVGVLGTGYPGYFPTGDAAALAAAILRAEEDPRFMAALRDGISRALPLVDPARERAAWQELLLELA
jgi:putative glycosyltransferase (TIGR04348 family)